VSSSAIYSDTNYSPNGFSVFSRSCERRKEEEEKVRSRGRLGVGDRSGVDHEVAYIRNPAVTHGHKKGKGQPNGPPAANEYHTKAAIYSTVKPCGG
jgi:hypothetical protein